MPNLTYSNFYVAPSGNLSKRYSIFSSILPNGSVLHIEGPEDPTPSLWLDDTKQMDLN